MNADRRECRIDLGDAEFLTTKYLKDTKGWKIFLTTDCTD